MKSSPLKTLAIFTLLLLCSKGWCQSDLQIIDKKVNFGYHPATNRSITNIIIHSVFNNMGGEKYDIDLVIKQFAIYRVSSHYVIARDGCIYRLTDESNVAFHAGKSKLPNGKSNINSTSIGIEILTSFEESPTDLQITALVKLVKALKKRYPIEFILRHSDIAPDRKTDPWNMDWEAFIKQVQ